MHQAEILAAYLKMAPVVPVLVVRQVADAVPLATALVEGGLPALEVTLRTPAALEAIREMSAVPGSAVGAGTVLDARQAEQAVKAGAQFLVSPGSTPELLDAAEELGVPFLPGVATASEAMAARDRGLRILKFFPAGQAGGPAYLKALASPLAELQFCPTGGITADNATSYLELPNVICVGGSWIAPQELVDAKRWSAIRELANAAANL
jgi:2-dehydro-3-deoxyphosphogluconate aldolase/(4S)-4-hydroxy-2-oxoglutarate aldolase